MASSAFLKLFKIIDLLAHALRSEENLLEFFLSFHHVGLGIKFMLSGLAALPSQLSC